MAINEKDQQQLSELFHRTTKGGAEATTATRLFNEKASALGLDSFKLYSSFVQGGSLAVYQPPQPPAVPQAPQTQTSTGGPDAGRWPDVITLRVRCSKGNDSTSLATFQKQPGSERYRIQRIVKENASGSSGSRAEPVTKDFPTALLDWKKQACPHCGAPIHNGDVGPVACGTCESMYCHAGVSSRWGSRYFRCPCGSKGKIGPVDWKARAEVVNTPPSVASSNTPALTHNSGHTMRLPAPGRRG
jgi:hypothetical protein